MNTLSEKKLITNNNSVVSRRVNPMNKPQIMSEAFKVEYNPETLKKLLDNDEPIFLTALIQRANAKNQNNRIYPKEVLKREIDNYIVDFVQKGNALGELDHPCFDDNVEVLSKRGWVNITEITEDDIVFTFNLDTKQYEWQKVDQKIVSNFYGDMYRIQHRALNILVTPNHKFVLKGRSDSKNRDNFELVMACELEKNHKKRFIKVEPDSWVGQDYDKIEIGGISFTPEDYFAFMGIYLSEGCTNKNTIIVSQVEKSEHYQDIVDLFDRIGMKYSFYGKSFSFYNKEFATYLNQFGLAQDKYIDENLKEATPELLEILLDWLIKGDGSIIKHNISETYSPKKMYYTTSEKLANDVQEICIKLGASVNIHTIQPTDRMIEGRLIKEENSRPLHRLTIQFTNYIHNDKRHLSVTTEHYEGNVYCVTVPNSTLVVRDIHNRVPLISGNSGLVVEYKTASHKIHKIWWEGDNVMARIEILSGKFFPCANILRGALKNNIPIGFSSRGFGSEMQLSEDLFEVEDDFQLVCWDAVVNPSTHGAFGVLTESKGASARNVLRQNAISEINNLVHYILK